MLSNIFSIFAVFSMLFTLTITDAEAADFFSADSGGMAGILSPPPPNYAENPEGDSAPQFLYYRCWARGRYGTWFWGQSYWVRTAAQIAYNYCVYYGYQPCRVSYCQRLYY